MKKRLKVYDLYLDGQKVGSSLWWEEVKTLIEEYERYYSDMGHKPKFKWIEV